MIWLFWSPTSSQTEFRRGAGPGGRYFGDPSVQAARVEKIYVQNLLECAAAPRFSLLFVHVVRSGARKITCCWPLRPAAVLVSLASCVSLASYGAS